MENTLRVRDIVPVGSVAAYPNVEDHSGQRSTVKASAYRNVKVAGKEQTECITFVADTFHNRCLFLLHREIEEVSVFEAGAFRRIPPAWAERVFEPCVGEGEPAAGQGTATPPAEPTGPDGEVLIQTLADLLKLPKAKQEEAVTSADCPVAMLQAVAACEDPAVSKRAKAHAIRTLEAMAGSTEAGKEAAGDGTDDVGDPD